MADGSPLAGQHRKPRQHLAGALTVKVKAGVDVTSQQVKLRTCQIVTAVHTTPDLQAMHHIVGRGITKASVLGQCTNPMKKIWSPNLSHFCSVWMIAVPLGQSFLSSFFSILWVRISNHQLFYNDKDNVDKSFFIL